MKSEKNESSEVPTCIEVATTSVEVPHRLRPEMWIVMYPVSDFWRVCNCDVRKHQTADQCREMAFRVAEEKLGHVIHVPAEECQYD